MINMMYFHEISPPHLPYVYTEYIYKYTYTAHKKFMNGFASRGFDPYVAIISTSRCEKTPVCKSAK